MLQLHIRTGDFGLSSGNLDPRRLQSLLDQQTTLPSGTINFTEEEDKIGFDLIV